MVLPLQAEIVGRHHCPILLPLTIFCISLVPVSTMLVINLVFPNCHFLGSCVEKQVLFVLFYSSIIITIVLVYSSILAPSFLYTPVY